jgi:hypothetical protein
VVPQALLLLTAYSLEQFVLLLTSLLNVRKESKKEADRPSKKKKQILHECQGRRKVTQCKSLVSASDDVQNMVKKSKWQKNCC